MVSIKEELERKKIAGSKRFGCFWACVLALGGMFVTAEYESSWALLGAGAIIILLLLSIGDLRRMTALLVISFFAGSVIGVIYWSWWAIPTALGVVLAAATTHRRWVTDPLVETMSRQNLESRSNSGGVQSNPSYSGGDGSTPGQAVVIQDVSSNREGVRAEYEYLRRLYGERGKDWELKEQSVFETNDGKQVDKLIVKTDSEDTETVYFDVSNFYGR